MRLAVNHLNLVLTKLKMNSADTLVCGICQDEAWRSNRRETDIFFCHVMMLGNISEVNTAETLNSTKIRATKEKRYSLYLFWGVYRLDPTNCIQPQKYLVHQNHQQKALLIESIWLNGALQQNGSLVEELTNVQKRIQRHWNQPISTICIFSRFSSVEID
jgi:hypothetical protein